jgi:hypothetical protein
MTNLHLDAMLVVRSAVADAGLKWTHEIRTAIRMSELSTNLYLIDPERFDLVLESELSYFTDAAA